MNQKYRLGLRAFKTAFSVLICLLISSILHRPDAFYASIAAIICMQHTYNETFQTGVHRLIGTIIGGIIGYLALILTRSLKANPQILQLILTPIFILIVIYLCNVINYKSSVAIGCIVLLSLIMNSDRNSQTALLYVINRVIDTSMGIITAMLINRFIFPQSKDKS